MSARKSILHKMSCYMDADEIDLDIEVLTGLARNMAIDLFYEMPIEDARNAIDVIDGIIGSHDEDFIEMLSISTRIAWGNKHERPYLEHVLKQMRNEFMHQLSGPK